MKKYRIWFEVDIDGIYAENKKDLNKLITQLKKLILAEYRSLPHWPKTTVTCIGWDNLEPIKEKYENKSTPKVL